MLKKSFSFKGINPLNLKENSRAYRKEQLEKIKSKIDKVSDRFPRDAIDFHERYNEYTLIINNRQKLLSPSQLGSGVFPAAAPKWLRDKIDALEIDVEQLLEKAQ